MIWPEIENKGFNILSICVAISIWGQKENPEKVIEKLLKSQEEKRLRLKSSKMNILLTWLLARNPTIPINSH